MELLELSRLSRYTSPRPPVNIVASHILIERVDRARLTGEIEFLKENLTARAHRLPDSIAIGVAAAAGPDPSLIQGEN